MKKILFFILLITSTQFINAQASFGIHGNAILASMQNKGDGEESLGGVLGDFESRFPWKFGGVANVPLSDQFSFMPQLNLLSKGGKIENNFVDFGEEFNKE